jgi:hypothetical protein
MSVHRGCNEFLFLWIIDADFNVKLSFGVRRKGFGLLN